MANAYEVNHYNYPIRYSTVSEAVIA